MTRTAARFRGWKESIQVGVWVTVKNDPIPDVIELSGSLQERDDYLDECMIV